MTQVRTHKQVEETAKREEVGHQALQDAIISRWLASPVQAKLDTVTAARVIAAKSVKQRGFGNGKPTPPLEVYKQEVPGTVEAIWVYHDEPGRLLVATQAPACTENELIAARLFEGENYQEYFLENLEEREGGDADA